MGLSRAEDKQIVLSAQASADFVKALLDPAEPSPELKRAVERYRAFLREETSQSESPTARTQ